MRDSSTALVGDLGPLLAALAVANDPPSTGWCTEEAEIVPTLWFTDDEGRAARVAYPMDGCGKPMSGQVRDALADLRRG